MVASAELAAPFLLRQHERRLYTPWGHLTCQHSHRAQPLAGEDGKRS
jgi:hypothetical protein